MQVWPPDTGETNRFALHLYSVPIVGFISLPIPVLAIIFGFRFPGITVVIRFLGAGRAGEDSHERVRRSIPNANEDL